MLRFLISHFLSGKYKTETQAVLIIRRGFSMEIAVETVEVFAISSRA